MRFRVIACMLFFSLEANAQPEGEPFNLKNFLFQQQDSLILSVLRSPATYRYQIIYTRIDRDKHNKPSFKNFVLNADTGLYFNPASTVKLPLAFLSLEKLNTINLKGVNKYTPMLTDSSWDGQTRVTKDASAENGLPSVAQYIRKAFLISDNDAYNRMYEFVGQETINRRLHEMGYPDTRITRRFVRATADQNRHTNAIRFVSADGKLLYGQPMAYNRDSFDFSRTHLMGNAYINADDSLINTPIDFTTANNLPLLDMQQLLQSVMFPKSVKKTQRFHLKSGDYDFLYRYLSQYPSETSYPKYDTSEYYDSYVKFFFRDDSHTMPPHVRVFNKVGWAYGCLTDVSYVLDFKNKVEFMLAVTIYVNSDGVMNDNKYEYKTIGWPFLYTVGQAVYKMELTRSRKYPPNLSRFQLTYQLRPEDGRKPIKNADN